MVRARLLLALAAALLTSTAFANLRAGCRFEVSATSYTVCYTEYSIAQLGDPAGAMLDIAVGTETYNWSTFTPYTAIGLYASPLYTILELAKPLDNPRFDFAFTVGFDIPVPPIFSTPRPEDEEE